MSSTGDTARAGRVLIIDDEALIGRSIQRALSRTYEVVVADSGARAIDILKADPGFDCVLCDLQMPEVSGMEVYEWVEREAAAVAPRFVFMTGGTFTDRAREFMARVPSDRIEKPFDMPLLRSVVDKVASAAPKRT